MTFGQASCSAREYKIRYVVFGYNANCHSLEILGVVYDTRAALPLVDSIFDLPGL